MLVQNTFTPLLPTTVLTLVKSPKDETLTHEEQINNSIEKINARIEKQNNKNSITSKLNKEFKGVRNLLKFSAVRVDAIQKELTNTKAFKALDKVLPLQKRDFTAKNLFKYGQKNFLFYTLTDESNKNILNKEGNCIYLLDIDGKEIKRQIFSSATIVSMCRNLLKERNSIK